MSDPRFFVDAELQAGTAIELPERVAHHAARVLRLADGAGIVVFNGRGGEFAARLVARGTGAELLRYAAIERESSVAVTLVQAWVATDKLDWIVEKAVELGAARLVLTPARRAVVQLDGARLERRLDRLRDIVVAACCQCGRNRLPALVAAPNLRTALSDAGTDAIGFVLHPEARPSLAEIAPREVTRVAMAIGPEGGFAEDEVEVATSLGYRAARLGPRVLRTETAGLAALAALQASIGDFR